MPATTNRTTLQLATDILQCPLVDAALRKEEAGVPCREVVTFQSRVRRYPPEPWSGHIDEAKILFLASNPGSNAGEIEPAEHELTADSSVDAWLPIFDNAFDQGQTPGIVDGVRMVDYSGQPRGRPVLYWVWAKDRAAEILGPGVDPGRDYALTEVVHCGSRSEHGVAEALPVCVHRYLGRVLRASPARILVCVGYFAQHAVTAHLDCELPSSLVGPVDLCGSPRYVVSIAHPSRFRRPTLDKTIGEQGLTRLVQWLADGVPR